MEDVLGPPAQYDRQRFDIDVSNDGTIWYYNGDPPDEIGSNPIVRISPAGVAVNLDPDGLGIAYDGADALAVDATGFVVSHSNADLTSIVQRFDLTGAHECDSPTFDDRVWSRLRPLGEGEWAMFGRAYVDSPVNPAQWAYVGLPCEADNGAVLVAVQEDDDILGFDSIGGRFLVGGTRAFGNERIGFMEVYEADGALRSSWTAEDEPAFDRAWGAALAPDGRFVLSGIANAGVGAPVGVAWLDPESSAVDVQIYPGLHPGSFQHVQLMHSTGDPWLFMAGESLQVATLPDKGEPCCPVEAEGWAGTWVSEARRIDDSLVTISVRRRSREHEYADAVIVRFDPA